MNRNTGILFFTLVVMMIGFGIIIPLLPFYVTDMGGSGISMGILMAVFSLMQFLFSPFWGDLSDRYGRKTFLMLGIFGNGISMVLMGFATELWMLFAARALAGLLSSATLPTAMAYISDSTDEESRGGGMGIIGAAMGIGMVLGPGIGGVMSDISLSAPFFLAAGLSALSLVFIWILLPESLPEEKRLKSEKKLQGPQIKAMWESLFSPIGFLFGLAFLLSFGLTNFEGVFGLYAEYRFDYDAKTVGMVLTVIGISSAVVQGALTGPAIRKWGDSAVIKTSLIASSVGFLLMLTATNLTTVMLTTGFFVISNAMLRPGVASLISKRATQGQGIAMGLNNSFMSLGRIVGPIWAGTVLDINLSYPYMTGSFIMALGFVAALIFLQRETILA
ncbi:MAG: MFS transporter [Anaerolineae bacterium]|jgi:DHA1 family multidrug resistance protein-like MFS transporter|nr:MFS transporter [Anaerolineae bacterium]MBT3712620.1 MFS transporter [Anaerolineae bacterium]MBT4312317.1 MFS transporter [Anaerolineae bacterium]MBT4457369.1 MFS transporter [Anaerolineae bacterium]MBT4842912.1 MFS transporter [Anaerolineae bacterium]